MELNVNKNGAATAADQLSEIVAKAEDLLSRMSQAGDAPAAELRQRVQKTIDNAKGRLSQLQNQTQDVVNKSVKSTDEYVRSNPWTAIAVAAGVGALLGAMVGRRL
jgi:ElaB/YqjD/DUF883 family membrane-anchored ribosome-binding protein